MFTQPVTDQCAYVLKAHEHVVLGISPFNSAFSREHLTVMIAWANIKFQQFHLYVPDDPLTYTLLACGYEPAKARKKAKRQINYLFNKINEALLANGFDPLQNHDLILCSRTLKTNPAYQ